MSNKRYQLLIMWNQNFVEAMPALKISWIELVRLARHVRRKWNQNVELHFLEWEEGVPNSLTLGSFTEKVLEAKDEISTPNNMG